MMSHIMKKYILGRKLNMTQLFEEGGMVMPVTLVQAGPLTVVRVKDTGAGSRTEVGFEAGKESRMSKAQLGHTKDKGVFKVLKEFSPETALLEGDKIDVTSFAKGDIVAVRGISKAKGFQGVVKRHGFKGGRRSHGQKHSEREPGSIGGGLRTRVPKGTRMGGRMGGDLIHVKNLKVVDIDAENNILAIKGAIPGRRGTLIEVFVK